MRLKDSSMLIKLYLTTAFLSTRVVVRDPLSNASPSTLALSDICF